MEKNIHDDRLDDYVKKSFEDYEEWPAADMWERVEGGLPLAETPVAAPKFGIRVFWSRMAVAATILLLLSALVCNHLYYENRLLQMAVQQQHNDVDVASPTAPSPAPSAGNKPDRNGSVSQANAQDLLQEANAGISVKKYQPGADKQHDSHPVAPSTTSASPTNVQVATTHQPGNPMAASGLPLLPSYPAIAPLDHAAAPQQALADLPAATPDSASDYPLKINNLLPVDLVNTSPLAYQRSFTTPIIRPLPTPDVHAARWYVGIHSTPVLLVEKTGPERPAGLRPRLVSTQVKTNFSADYWLKFGRKGSGIWGFESGIGYRTVERTTTHTARFRLMNGRLYSGAQGRGYDFDYDLDTYSGSMEVTMRMEQVDPAANLPESEPVRIQVTAREQTSMLRIPLLTTATLGKNRLQTVFKAGLLGNVMLDRQVDIVARSSENTLLQPSQGTQAYSLRQVSSGKLFLGYQVSGGLQYRTGKHFSWVLEPSLAGEFPRKNNAGRPLPSITTVGVNAGVNYWF